jgi:hypothetical protein
VGGIRARQHRAENSAGLRFCVRAPERDVVVVGVGFAPPSTLVGNIGVRSFLVTLVLAAPPKIESTPTIRSNF